MKIFHPNGSRERLFEMMFRVNSLNEEILPPEKRKVVVDSFINFVCKKLGLKIDNPKVILSYDDNLAQEMKSYGRYVPNTNEILVIATNRGLADILRTIAHELIHLKQMEDGRINPNSGDTGSPEENEANALAGVLMRDFGKNNPIIFE